MFPCDQSSSMLVDRHERRLFQHQWHLCHPPVPLCLFSPVSPTSTHRNSFTSSSCTRSFPFSPYNLCNSHVSLIMQVSQVVTISTLTMLMATAVRMPTSPLRDPSLRLSGISGGWSGSSTQPTLS